MNDDALLDAVESDWRTAELGPRRQAILDYAVKLTVSPAEVREGDIRALREQGLADEDILGLCECVAYYAYANRIANGLGVELEGD